MKIKLVSLAGVDDNVSIPELMALYSNFPMLELGILLSKKSAGIKNRYPSMEYIKELCEQKGTMPLSGHICGQWMKDLLQGNLTVFEDLKELWPYFSRIQFNYVNYFNDENVPGSYETKVEKFLEALKADCWAGKELIFPYNDKSRKFVTENVLGIMPEAQILHDASMGKGEAQTQWLPAFPNHYTGYAGGLGPTKLNETLIAIGQAVDAGEGGAEIWLDMESGLRTEDNEFSLGRALMVMRKASQYVGQKA